MFAVTFKDAWWMLDNFWTSNSVTRAATSIAASLYNKYTIWDVLVTN